MTVQRYPNMTYQVDRACAGASDTDFYLELDIFPEISIAEEARANGSTRNFNIIMEHSVKYKSWTITHGLSVPWTTNRLTSTATPPSGQCWTLSKSLVNRVAG